MDINKVKQILGVKNRVQLKLQNGGRTPIVGTSQQQQAYQDSLNLYNSGEYYYNKLKEKGAPSTGYGEIYIYPEDFQAVREDYYKKYPMNMPANNYNSGRNFQPISNYGIAIAGVGQIESSRYKKPVQPIVIGRPKDPVLQLNQGQQLLPESSKNINFNPIPYEQGTYFTRNPQQQEIGKTEYFDKKTGKPLNKFQDGGSVKLTKEEVLRAVQQAEEANRSNKYEPTQAVKNIKAALSSASLLAPANLPARIGSSIFDLGTATKYALDGQYGKATEDAVQAGLNWVPFLQQKNMINLSKNTVPLAYRLNQAIPYINQANTYINKANDAKTISEMYSKDKPNILKGDMFNTSIPVDNLRVQPQKRKIVLQDGGMSQLGYKEGSPYEENPFNLINSNQITMKGVTKKVIGISDTGEIKVMNPNEEHSFSGTTVMEFPKKTRVKLSL